MRVGAEDGKGGFIHVGLGDDHAACGAKLTHHRRVGCGWRRIGEDLGPSARRLAGDIEEVLDAHQGAIERSERHAGARTRVGSIGSGTGDIGIHGEAGALTLAVRVSNPSERLLQAVTGGPLRLGSFNWCLPFGWG